MAIRKFGKYMKVVSILVILSLVLSAGYTGFNFLTNYAKNNKVLMKVENKKIYEKDFMLQYETLKANIKGQDGSGNKNITEDLLKEAVLSSLLDEIYTSILVDSYKIKVSNDKINEVYSEIENQTGGKSKLSIALGNYGKTINDLKEEIKRNEAIKEIRNQIANTIEVSDKELEEFYSIYKYTNYENKPFETIKEQVKLDYLSDEIAAVMQTNIDKIKETAKYDFKDESIKSLFDDMNKVLIEEYNIKKSNILSKILGYMTKTEATYEESEKLLLESLNSEISMLKEVYSKAEKENIKVSSDINEFSKLLVMFSRYKNHFIATFDTTEEEKRNFFEQVKAQYDTPESVNGYILGKEFTPSKADEEKTLEKVKEIRKELTPKNFAEKAKKYSIDGSKENGGSLGERNINEYVTEFRDASSKLKVGEISEPVKTQFGYHLIYVEKENEKDKNIKTLSHILIPIEISEETKKTSITKIEEIKKDLEDKKITFESIKKDDNVNILSNLTNVTKDQRIPGIEGYDALVIDKLFNAKIGDIVEIKEDNRVLILSVTSKQEYVSAKYEDHADEIRIRLAEYKFNN